MARELADLIRLAREQTDDIGMTLEQAQVYTDLIEALETAEAARKANGRYIAARHQQARYVVTDMRKAADAYEALLDQGAL